MASCPGLKLLPQAPGLPGAFSVDTYLSRETDLTSNDKCLLSPVIPPGSVLPLRVGLE